MKNKLLVLRSRSARLVAAGTALVAAGAANAALPVGATTAFSDIQTDALALIDLVWPAAIAITSGFIVLKLFKRAANKAT